LNGETCRFNKSIYGLTQASRAWNKKLDKQLKEFGFSQSNFDPCVYFKLNNGKILIIAVYVDDLLMLSYDKKEKRKLKMSLMKEFKMKDLAEAHYCLGIRIQRDRRNGVIILDQQKHIE
jgi:Reverse transcriptase (RNA-dependent DNA polymerase)